MPAPSQSLTAVIVSGGKQYRVAPGDRILVDRLAAEPGSELTLDRVLLVADGDDVKVSLPGVEGPAVTARVLGDRRGPKIDVLRYKSKKRVRVHRGARADLTVLEILTIAGKGAEAPAKPAKAEKPEKPAAKPRAKAAVKTAAKAEVAEAPAEEAASAAVEETPVEEAPKPARRTRAKAAEKPAEEPATEEETTDGA